MRLWHMLWYIFDWTISCCCVQKKTYTSLFNSILCFLSEHYVGGLITCIYHNVSADFRMAPITDGSNILHWPIWIRAIEVRLYNINKGFLWSTPSWKKETSCRFQIPMIYKSNREPDIGSRFTVPDLTCIKSKTLEMFCSINSILKKWNSE